MKGALQARLCKLGTREIELNKRDPYIYQFNKQSTTWRTKVSDFMNKIYTIRDWSL